MLYKAFSKFDDLAVTNPNLRFLIFLCLVTPACLLLGIKGWGQFVGFGWFGVLMVARLWYKQKVRKGGRIHL